MVAKPKRLDESRQIELAQMVEFMESDEDYLEGLLDEAGNGVDGDYEKFRISMARYWLAGARTYLEDIVDTWLSRDDRDIYGENAELKDIPMTIVKPDDIVKISKKVTTTTVTDDKGKVSTAEVLEPEKKNTPKSTSKPWVPAWKDEDKIVGVIREILNDVPDDEWGKPGFQGWLAGSATAALGGKTEPALMLDKVREVLASV